MRPWHVESRADPWRGPERVTASQARRNWFRLLDEIVAGEVVVIERKGQRIVLRREEDATDERAEKLPDYSGLLRVPDADRADRWTWAWPGPEGHLALDEEGVSKPDETS